MIVGLPKIGTETIDFNLTMHDFHLEWKHLEITFMIGNFQPLYFFLCCLQMLKDNERHFLNSIFLQEFGRTETCEIENQPIEAHSRK